MHTYAQLAKELRELYPDEVQRLFDRDDVLRATPFRAADAVAAVQDVWASEVSCVDEQWAAVRKQENMWQWRSRGCSSS